MKTFLVRPAPVPSRFGGSRSMGLPEFDPFWEEVVNAGIPVTMHASDSGYQKHLMEWEGGGEYLSFKPERSARGRDGSPRHRGHPGGHDLPRRAVALPRPEDPGASRTAAAG